MQNDAYYEAQQQEDVLDASSGVAQSFDSMINQSDVRRRQEMIERMRQTTQAPTPTVPVIAPPTVDPYANLTPTAPTTDEPRLTYNPYPTSIHQSVINPLGTKPQSEQPAPVAATIQPSIPTAPAPQAPPVETTTSETIVSPDIINLANNSDLSIETIAHEANRIHQKEEKLPEEEVVISLR